MSTLTSKSKQKLLNLINKELNMVRKEGHELRNRLEETYAREKELLYMYSDLESVKTGSEVPRVTEEITIPVEKELEVTEEPLAVCGKRGKNRVECTLGKGHSGLCNC